MGIILNMKNSLIISIVGAVILIGVIIYVVNKQNTASPVMDVSPTESTQSPNTDEVVDSSPDTSDLRVGGSSYLDPQGIFNFLYPNDYTLDTQDPLHTRVYKRGEMDRPQGEITNGVIVVFEPINLQGQSLESLVDSRIAETTTNGTATIVQAKQATTMNTYSGFTYETGGFGSAKYLVLQRAPGSSHAVSISVLVNDPEQKNYQQEVDGMLSTLELLK